MYNAMENLLPVGTAVICNGSIDVIAKHVEPGTENYLQGYRYELKEHGTQSIESVSEYKPDNVHEYITYSARGKQVWVSFKLKSSTGSYAIANCMSEQIANEISNSLNLTDSTVK